LVARLCGRCDATSSQEQFCESGDVSIDENTTTSQTGIDNTKYGVFLWDSQYKNRKRASDVPHIVCALIGVAIAIAGAQPILI